MSPTPAPLLLPDRGDGALALALALANAAASVARLDAMSGAHPMARALVHRARLDAACRHAAVDGEGRLDPWRIAAALEDVPIRAIRESAAPLPEVGALFEAQRLGLRHVAWLAAPGFDEEGGVAAALAALLSPLPGGAPPAGTAAGEGGRPGRADGGGGDQRGPGAALLRAAWGAWRWIEGGGARPPLRAALVRLWRREALLRQPVPITGAAALAPGVPWRPPAAWAAAFLRAVAAEARGACDLLVDMERRWFAARKAVAGAPGRRRTSRLPLAVDVLAALPLASATTLAASAGMSVKAACEALDELVRLGVAAEATRRGARRLFGLAGQAGLAEGLRDAAAPPRRRGLRAAPAAEVAVEERPVGDLPPLSPLERATFDYGDLEAAMRAVDEALHRSRFSPGACGADRRQEPPTASTEM